MPGNNPDITPSQNFSNRGTARVMWYLNFRALNSNRSKRVKPLFSFVTLELYKSLTYWLLTSKLAFKFIGTVPTWPLKNFQSGASLASCLDWPPKSSHGGDMHSHERLIVWLNWLIPLECTTHKLTWLGTMSATSRPPAAETHAVSWCSLSPASPESGELERHWSAYRTLHSAWSCDHLCVSIIPCRKVSRRTFASHDVRQQLNNHIICHRFCRLYINISISGHT